jgi:hypothetical protein
MSYESKMLEQFSMPTRQEVMTALLRVLLKHGGVIKEFNAGEQIVGEIADHFGLNKRQRLASLETVYRKESRIKKSNLWHRLLFRAADLLATENLVSRPTQTLRLTEKKEWMLTEKGYYEALKICNIPVAKKDQLSTKSYEVQTVVKKLVEAPRPENYDPVDKNKKIVKTTKESALRTRGFRLAVIEAYNCRCAVCGLKIKSPDLLTWEVEAAHIVPNSSLGRDDVCNGIALCHLHHWAFDIGWFTLLDNYSVEVSPRISRLPSTLQESADYEFIPQSSHKG